MGRGKPTCTKCPRCKRGKHGHAAMIRGVVKIGHETAARSGKGSGHGSGGSTFHGHRGIMECLDCGHIWPSTLEGVRWYQKERLAARLNPPERGKLSLYGRE